MWNNLSHLMSMLLVGLDRRSRRLRRNVLEREIWRHGPFKGRSGLCPLQSVVRVVDELLVLPTEIRLGVLLCAGTRPGVSGPFTRCHVVQCPTLGP